MPQTNIPLMIERVAQAMARAESNPDDAILSREDFHAIWQSRARSAIEAMRDPAPEMVAAGDHIIADGVRVEYDCVVRDEGLAKATFIAMIDVALLTSAPESVQAP